MLTGIQTLVLCARQHGADLSEKRLMHDYALTDEEPNDTLLIRIAKENDIRAKAVRLNWKKLTQLGQAFPAILRLENGNSVVLVGFDQEEGGPEQALVLDPLSERPDLLKIDRKRLESAWNGRTILLKRQMRATDPNAPFGFRWFLPEFSRQKVLFFEIALIAIVLHAVALVIPIYIQIVLDRVLSNQAYATLYVLTTGVVVAVAAFMYWMHYLGEMSPMWNFLYPDAHDLYVTDKIFGRGGPWLTQCLAVLAVVMVIICVVLYATLPPDFGPQPSV